ncbi:hypothetical protein CcaCcLH18_02060 [Colletotrichum camelliae]|nr:hypothetical protein CcaCcLH18_02060 [Colletotrichum camelliae]
MPELAFSYSPTRESLFLVGHPPVESCFPSPQHDNDFRGVSSPNSGSTTPVSDRQREGSHSPDVRPSTEDRHTLSSTPQEIFELEDSWVHLPIPPSTTPRPRRRDVRSSDTQRAPCPGGQHRYVPQLEGIFDIDIPDRHASNLTIADIQQHIAHLIAEEPRLRASAPSPPASAPHLNRRSGSADLRRRYTDLPEGQGVEMPRLSRMPPNEVSLRCRCEECTCPREADFYEDMLTEEQRKFCGYCRAFHGGQFYSFY